MDQGQFGEGHTVGQELHLKARIHMESSLPVLLCLNAKLLMLFAQCSHKKLAKVSLEASFRYSTDNWNEHALNLESDFCHISLPLKV